MSAGAAAVARRTPGRAGSLVSLLTIAFALVAFAPTEVFHAEQAIGQRFRLLDGSWALEIPERLLHAEWAGRDFVFTYGPLYQIVHALGILIPAHDVASVFRFNFLLEHVLGVLIGWFLLSWTGAPLTWRVPLFLFWGATGVPNLKPMAGLFAVAACARLAHRGSGSRLAPALAVWAISAPLATMYAVDLGLITLGSLLLSAIVLGLGSRPGPRPEPAPGPRGYAGLGGAALVGFVLWVSAMRVLPGWGRFGSDSLRILVGYTNMMALPCPGVAAAGLACVGACAAGCLVLAFRRLRTDPTAHSAMMASVACFCLLHIRHGLTRSDRGHVAIASIPTAFLIGCLLPCDLRARGARWARVALFASLCIPPATLAMVGGGNPFPREAFRGLPPGLPELAPARLSTSGALAEAVAAAARLPGPIVYVWPHETAVAGFAGKHDVSYTVQSYSAHDAVLEDATVAKLEESRPPVLLFTNSVRIDEVEGLTRTPRIFRHLIENYELLEPPGWAFLLLRHVGPRGWEERSLAALRGAFRPGHSTGLELPCAADDLLASDLVVLRLRLSRVPSFGIRKPGRLRIGFLLDTGEQRTQFIVVPADGNLHELIVSASLIGDPWFPVHFTRDCRWVSPERVVRLSLTWLPLDFLSAAPREVRVEGASVLWRPRARAVPSTPAAAPDSGFWLGCTSAGGAEPRP